MKHFCAKTKYPGCDSNWEVVNCALILWDRIKVHPKSDNESGSVFSGILTWAHPF